MARVWYLSSLIERSDSYQMLLVPWKNINPNLKYRWSKVKTSVIVLYVLVPIARSEKMEYRSSPTFFDHSSLNSQFLSIFRDPQFSKLYKNFLKAYLKIVPNNIS